MAEQPTHNHQADEIEARVRHAFLRLTLQVGGLVAQHPDLPDDAVFALCRRVDETFRTCLSTLRAPDDTPPRPAIPGLNMQRHPAVVHLLSIIDPNHKTN